MSEIKIICLNLFEGGLLWENIEQFLKKENADILCFQEVFRGSQHQPPNFNSIPRLQKVLPKYDYFFSPESHAFWPAGGVDVGNGIFSRFPIKEKETIFLFGEYVKVDRPKNKNDFSKDPKNMQHAVIEIDGKQLHVCNMHGIWGLDGGDNPARLRMSEIMVQAIKGKEPAVLMGDFNLKPNTQTIRNIEKIMTNVFKDELTTSFNMRHKTNPGYATAVVDMFFASSTVKVLSKSCPEDDVSDHKPLVVSIEI